MFINWSLLERTIGGKCAGDGHCCPFEVWATQMCIWIRKVSISLLYNPKLHVVITISTLGIIKLYLSKTLILSGVFYSTYLPHVYSGYLRQFGRGVSLVLKAYHNSHFLVLSCPVCLVCVCLSMSLSLVIIWPFLSQFSSPMCFFTLFLNLSNGNISFNALIFVYTLLKCHLSLHHYIWLVYYQFFLYIFNCWLNKLQLMQHQAMRNLIASVTYQEWRGHHCGSLPLPARILKHMKPQVHCAAAARLSLPFCSKMMLIKRCRG